MGYAQRIRVAALHHDPITRAGLSAAMADYPDFDVLTLHFEGEDLCAVLQGARHSLIDIVVSDYSIGVALAALITQQGLIAGMPKVLILDGMDREWELRSALEQGVRGFMMVGCSLDALAAGIRAVHHGSRHLSPQIAARLAESVSAEPLTVREEEVLRLVVEGLCNKAISKRLGIAVGTVKSHLKATFAKLNVDSRTQAAAAAERRGLLRPRPPRVVPSTVTCVPKEHNRYQALERTENAGIEINQ